jgi:hypothetical protein
MMVHPLVPRKAAPEGAGADNAELAAPPEADTANSRATAANANQRRSEPGLLED